MQNTSDNGECMASQERAKATSGACVKLKEGQILRYKKRLFGCNWRPAHLTLFSNASFTIAKPGSQNAPNRIQCQQNSTLIIFGQQLKLVPKRPTVPSGYKLEQMLAIGLIEHMYTPSGKLKGTQIIFYWFLSPSVNDLLEWIIAFQNSLLVPAKRPSIASSLPPVPTLEPLDNSHLTHATSLTSFMAPVTNQVSLGERTAGSQPHTANGTPAPIRSGMMRSAQDDLSLGLLMANTQHYINSLMPGIAAASAASMLAGSSINTDNLLSNLPTSHLMQAMQCAQTNASANYLLNSNSNMFGGPTDAAVCAGSVAGGVPNVPLAEDIINSANLAGLTTLNSLNANSMVNFNAPSTNSASGTNYEVDNHADCFDNPTEFSTLSMV